MNKLSNWLQRLKPSLEDSSNTEEDKRKPPIQGLTLEEYKKYSVTSASNVSIVDDLSKFGLNVNWHGTEENEKLEFAYRPFINSEEEKIVKPGDWQYRINKYNFREPWNFKSKKPKIGFFGCSFTFGEGIEYKDTFVNIVSEKFNLNPFNFGVGGSSVHRVARTFSAVTKVIDLEYAVLTLPHWHRQMYIDDNGKLINLIPYWPHSRFVEISNQLTNLEEEYYVVQAVSFVSWICDLAEARGIKLILSSWDYPLSDLCKVMYPNIAIDVFPNIDDKCARDYMHPGIKSQYAHAEQIIKAINDRAWI
jgi:hypothetical protein